jgi:thiamine biosynthesis lipoprotein
VELDLGATAKALAADQSAARAARSAGTGVLVSLGGDIAVAGVVPSGGWPVRIADDHAAGPDEPGPTVAIEHGGLATSGTTVRRWRAGERELHHIVDPRTGRPAETPWRTVTVAASSCVDANVAGTAAVVLGEDASRWLAARGLAARLVRESGEAVYAGGWPEDPT